MKFSLQSIVSILTNIVLCIGTKLVKLHSHCCLKKSLKLKLGESKTDEKYFNK